ncbi:hypothetical protein [Megasphaera elsdenii]
MIAFAMLIVLIISASKK